MPDAAPIPGAPPVSGFAETQALIQQIANEARSSGRSLAFDPDAPLDAEGSDDAPAPAKAGKGKKPVRARAGEPGEGETPATTESNPDGNEDTEAEEQEQAEDPGEEAEAEEQEQARDVDLGAVRAALDAEGGVDLIALAAALGKEPEQLGLTPGQAKFLRLERKKATQTLERAQTLAETLRSEYGSQALARKAAGEGKLEPAVEFIEKTFGMDWNELNKAVADLLQGKPVKDIESKRRLKQLEAEKAEREANEKTAADKAAADAKIASAKTWIQNQIKGDKLATPELDKQLRDAGFPSVVDLVYDELKAGYSKGLTDPKKALENVRARLTRQAKALRTAGLAPKAPTDKPAPVTRTSRPRADAQSGNAGNKSRDLTDAELRQAVLKEAGLWR